MLRRLLERLIGVERPAAPSAPPPSARLVPQPRAAAPADRGSALLGLLAHLRGAATPSAGPALGLTGIGSGTGRPDAGNALLSCAAMTRSHPGSARFRLAVDDGGELLVHVGAEATIGHLRARDVALPFLLDVEEHHARLVLAEDFHGGASWRLAPGPTAAARVNGRDVREPESLADGDVVLLGSNLAFRFRAREEGSSSARLDLLHGAECLGASRVLLLAPGPGGRVRLGAKATRHVPVPGLEHEIEIAAESHATGDRLFIGCTAGVRGARTETVQPRIELPLPLAGAVTLVARARKAGEPPFALILTPVEPPAPVRGVER